MILIYVRDHYNLHYASWAKSMNIDVKTIVTVPQYEIV